MTVETALMMLFGLMMSGALMLFGFAKRIPMMNILAIGSIAYMGSLTDSVPLIMVFVGLILFNIYVVYQVLAGE